MHSVSKDMRRATRDMDIDFIKYSLENKSIRKFIEDLINVDDDMMLNYVFYCMIFLNLHNIK